MAIRKWTKIEIPAGTPKNIVDKVKGVRITPSASAFVRTICSCGFADAAQVYKCPNCGNEEFIICDSYETEFAKDDPKFTVSGQDVDVSRVTWTIFLGTEVTVAPKTRKMFERKGPNVNIDSYSRDNNFYDVLKKNYDKLPDDIKDAVNMCEEFELDVYHSFKDTLRSRPRLDIFIQMEKAAHPEFVKELVRSVIGSWNHYPDIDFSTMSEFYSEYKIPAEFRPFVDTKPHEMIDKTYLRRHRFYGRTPSREVFQVPTGWENVPNEIKSVANYYLENGVIDFDAYCTLGSIDKELLTKYKQQLNQYFKKYMMMFTNRIVYAVNKTYQYLVENGIPVTDATLDEKYCNQRRNIEEMKQNLSRHESDIDNFINACDFDAVNALHQLACSKRTRKAKKEEE